jgi:hypothetical protein
MRIVVLAQVYTGYAWSMPPAGEEFNARAVAVLKLAALITDSPRCAFRDVGKRGRD